MIKRDQTMVKVEGNPPKDAPKAKENANERAVEVHVNLLRRDPIIPQGQIARGRSRKDEPLASSKWLSGSML